MGQLCTPEADDEEALLCVQEDLVQELDRMDLVLSGVLPEEPVVVKEVQSLEAPIVQSLEALTISVEEQPQPVGASNQEVGCRVEDGLSFDGVDSITSWTGSVFVNSCSTTFVNRQSCSAVCCKYESLRVV